MNYKMVGFVLGRIFLIEAALMLFPMGCAAIYGEWSVVLSFLWPTLIVLVLGLITSLRTPQNTKIYARDGLAIVALVWVLMSVFGALPFVISGEIPSFADAFFETVSGFTTTGSTILTDVEALSHGTLFWRSFSHWIGGMGVLVFAMAVLPMTDGRAMHLMRAEVPGPTCGKISSKLSDSAKILYAIYLVMTVIETILLCAGGMPLFDALIHAFGTAGTGGFSNKALSVGAYNSPYFEIVIGVFMLLFGINFNLYYFLLLRHFRAAFASEEMRVYLGHRRILDADDHGEHREYVRQCRHGAAHGVLPGVVHRHDHRLRHGGLQPLADLLPHRDRDPDVCGRMRGLDGGRLESIARHHPFQGGTAGPEQDAAQPCRDDGPL